MKVAAIFLLVIAAVSGGAAPAEYYGYGDSSSSAALTAVDAATASATGAVCGNGVISTVTVTTTVKVTQTMCSSQTPTATSPMFTPPTTAVDASTAGATEPVPESYPSSSPVKTCAAKKTVTVTSKRSAAAPTTSQVQAIALPTVSKSTEAKVSEATPAAAAGTTGWRQVMVNEHNKYRALHKAGPVTYDLELEKALEAAIKAKKNSVCPNGHIGGKLNADQWGENYYASSASMSMEQLATDASAAWYKTGAGCAYGKSNSYGDCGHFTQLVWKDSTRIGCAMTTVAQCGNQGLGSQSLCAYLEAGNVMFNNGYSLYKQNVIA